MATPQIPNSEIQNGANKWLNLMFSELFLCFFVSLFVCTSLRGERNVGGVANTSAPMGHTEYLNVITFNFSFLQCAFELVSVHPVHIAVYSHLKATWET